MITALPSLAETAEQIRAGSLSPLELVEYCLGQIERFDGQVNAFVLVDGSGARQAAAQLAETLQNGNWLGPLHGIPIAIKDIIDVEGFPTKAGSPLRKRHVAGADAELVARLRQCGAIILGKTVTTQFAGFDPPPTRNPWNLGHTPGGSSSGSAAAVALEMCAVAFGTQTGGSIIRPAAYCGVAGLKPSFGSVSLKGVVPLSQHLDHAGPIARTAADLRVFWHTFATPSPELFTPAVRGVFRERRPRVIHLEGFFWEAAEPDVREAAEAALSTLARAGAEVVSLPLPESFAHVHAQHRRIMAVEAAACHRGDFRSHSEAYAPQISALIWEGMEESAVDYLAALAHQQAFRREMTQLWEALEHTRPTDALVTPATSTTAPEGHETTGDPKFNSPWSHAGLPTVCFPCGVAPGGLPCGLQLVGFADEASLLDTAAWCEAKLGVRAVPPMLSEQNIP